MTLAKQSYRMAIVALRDSRWEEATLHLLTLLADAPEYRDVGQVLIRLEQTRPLEYWCAVFDFSVEHQIWVDADTALQSLTQIAPGHPRLDEMRQQLSAASSTEPSLGPDLYEPVAEPVAEPVGLSLTDRISAAMIQEPVENHSLKHWLEASALEDSAPVPVSPPDDSEPISDADFDRLEAAAAGMLATAEPDLLEQSPSEPVETLAADSAADDEPYWLDPLPVEQPSEQAVIPSFDGILVDDMDDGGVPDDTLLSTGQPPSTPDGDSTEATDLEQTQPRSITIHEADSKKKRGWPDALLLILELLALLAIVIIVAAMAVGGDSGNAFAIDRYGGSIQMTPASLPETIPDLVGAVDRQLVRINETQVALDRLYVLAGLVGELAGDDEALATALTVWIVAGTVELDAAAAMNDVCAETGLRSAACADGIATHAAHTREAAAEREQVCALMNCPAN